MENANENKSFTLFIPKENIKGKEVYFYGNDAEEIREYIEGNENFVLYGRLSNGKRYELKIDKMFSHKISAQIKSESEIADDKVLPISLLIALPKEKNMLGVIEHSAQTGIREIIPIATNRKSVDEKTFMRLLKKYRKYAFDASCECGRKTPLDIRDPLPFNAAVALNKEGESLKVFPFELEDKNTLSDFSEKEYESAFVLMGNEQGFTRQEYKLATDEGYYPVSLGPFIMRVDIACAYTLSIVANYLS